MVRRYLIFLLSLLLPLALFAQQIDVETAAQKARKQWTKGIGGKRLAPAKARPKLAYTAKIGDEVQFYVFNNQADGFIIIGGDETAVEILGQSDNGNFDENHLPANFRWYLSQLQNSIHNGIHTKNGKRRLIGERHDVPELVKTKWGQEWPYYNQVVANVGGYYPTGCVATAMGQVMKFWETPTRGKGTKTYTVMNMDKELTVDFSQSEYDWANMTNEYLFDATEAEQYAVSKLLYDCGVSVEMTYADGGSSATELMAAMAFPEYFGYDKSCQYVERSFYDDDTWEKMIYDEVAAGRPMLYGGVDVDDGGHAFVCDGYRASDNTYHFNWGWQGGCDGYYAITGTTVLNPTAIYSFELLQHAVIGIRPECGGDYHYTINCMTTCGFTNPFSTEVKEDYYTTDRTETYLMLEGQYANYGTATIASGELGLKLVKDNTGMETDEPNVVQYLSGYVTLEDFAPGYMYTAMYFYPSQINANGLYYVYPVYRVGAGEWIDMPVPQGWMPPMLLVEGTEPSFYLLEQPSMPNDHYFTKDNIEVTARIYNNTNSTLNKSLYVDFRENGSTVATLYRYVSLPVGESTLTFTESNSPSGIDGLEEGKDYKVRIRPYGASALSGEIYAHCVAQKAIPYTLSSAKWGTLILPYDAEIPEGLTVYSTENYDDDGCLTLTGQTSIARDTPYIIGGEPGDYNFTGPDRPVMDYYTAGLLTGVTSDVKAPVGSYVLLKKNGVVGFYRVVSGKEPTVGAHRAYLKKMDNCPLSTILFPSQTTTGVKTVIIPAEKHNFYQLNPLIRIENGKKILSK